LDEQQKASTPSIFDPIRSAIVNIINAVFIVVARNDDPMFFELGVDRVIPIVVVWISLILLCVVQQTNSLDFLLL